MFSSVKVYPSKNENGTIKANGSFLLNEAFVIKFTVMSGKNGLFVGLPGRYGKDPEKPDDPNAKKWYSDVYVMSDDVRKQMTDLVIAEYNKETGNTFSDQSTPSAQSDGPTSQVPQNAGF